MSKIDGYSLCNYASVVFITGLEVYKALNSRTNESMLMAHCAPQNLFINL